MKDLEAAEVKNYKELEEFWSEFGPVSAILFIGFTAMSCCSVMVCFKRYRKHLEEYESSPFNSANEV